MKNLMLTIMLLITTFFTTGISSLSDEFQGASNSLNSLFFLKESNRPEPPEYSFYTEPLPVTYSFHDYFPGGLVSFPLGVQSANHNGVYMVNLAQISGLGRLVSFAYIDEGVTIASGLMDMVVNPNSYPAIAMDHVTDNPFVSWSNFYGNCILTYDSFDLIESPGLWNPVYELLQNACHPVLFVVPSPNPGERRLYVFSSSLTSPCESRFAYADFSHQSDLHQHNPDIWTIVDIPFLGDWYTEGIRVFWSPIVSPYSGRVAIVGHTRRIDTDDPYHEDNFLFVLENDDLDFWEWTLFTGDPTISVENPDDYFVDEENEPYQDMRYILHANRHNVSTDECGNYNFVGVFMLYAEDNSSFPYLSTAKHVQFTRADNGFVINHLYPVTDDDNYLPWGDQPQYVDDQLICNLSWICYWYDVEDFQLENYHRIVQEGPNIITLLQCFIISMMMKSLKIGAMPQKPIS